MTETRSARQQDPTPSMVDRMVAEASLHDPPPLDPFGQRRLRWLPEEVRWEILQQLAEPPELVVQRFLVSYRCQRLADQHPGQRVLLIDLPRPAAPAPDGGGTGAGRTTVSLARVTPVRRVLQAPSPALAARAAQRAREDDR